MSYVRALALDLAGDLAREPVRDLDHVQARAGQLVEVLRRCETRARQLVGLLEAREGARRHRK